MISRPSLIRRIAYILNAKPVKLRRNIVLLLLVATLINCFLPLSWVAALIAGIVAVYILPLGKKGLITRIILILALVVSINTMLGFIFWALKIPITPNGVVWIYLVALALIALSSAPTKLVDYKHFPKEDIYSLMAMAACFLFLIFPVVQKRDTANLLRFVTMGVDNIAHIDLIRLVEGNQGYLQGDQELKSKEMIAGITGYQQGYHLNFSLAGKLIVPAQGVHRPSTLLKLFIVFEVLIYSLLAYLGTYLVLIYAKKLGLLDHGVNYGVAAIAMIYFFTNIMVDIFFYGFQPQIMSLFLLLAQIVFLNMIFEVRGQKEKYFYMTAALLLGVGMSFVYLFSLPAGVVSLSATLLLLILGKKINLSRKSIYIVIILLLISLIPAWMHIVYLNQPNKISESGGALELDKFILIGGMVISLAYIALRKVKCPQFGVLGVYILSSAGFTAAIYLYLKLIHSSGHYFLFKSTYAMAILIMIAITVLTIELTQIFGGGWYAGLFAVGLALLLIGLRTPHGKIYFYGQVHTQTLQFSDMLARLIQDKKYLDNSTKIISVGHNCIVDNDLYLMRTLTAFSGDGNLEQAKIAEYTFSIKARPLFYEKVKKYQENIPGHRLIVITPSETIKQEIISNAGKNADKIEFINLLPNTGLATGCEP